MTIADVLTAEFLAAGGDVERGRDRAADAAACYIVRRLQQLERRFPRHVFAFSHQRHGARLLVYPRVVRVNDVQSLLNLLCSRSTRWRTMSALRRVEVDLHAVSYRTEQEFDRLLGYMRSSGWSSRRSAVHVLTEAARTYDDLVMASRREDERRLNRGRQTSPRGIGSGRKVEDRRMVHDRS